MYNTLSHINYIIDVCTRNKLYHWTGARIEASEAFSVHISTIIMTGFMHLYIGWIVHVYVQHSTHRILINFIYNIS